ncbi:MAG: c-type cytochrome domain-containing protein, partial [Pirellulales bacterium]
MIKSRISIIKQGTGAFLAVWMAAACSLPLHGQEGEIDFAREIEPLLKKHCIACHGLDAQNAGLRLDSAEQAAIGGVSGKPILGGTRETNELFSRIHSDDPTYRMPKNGPPLTSDEIERIGRWVDQGTPWPEPVSPVIVRAPPSAWDKLMDLIEGRRSNEWT